jgi:tetratricopeptide (TPR) repeat protein
LKQALVWILCVWLPLPAQQMDPGVAQQISSGDRELAAGNYTNARAIYLGAADRLGSIAGATLPQLHSAYAKRLEAEILTGDYNSASQLAQGMLSRGISTTPEEQAHLAYLQARIAVERGEFDAAAGLLDRAMAAGGTLGGEVRATAAELLRRQEKFADSTKAFAEAAGLLRRLGKPLTREVTFASLEVLVTQGKYAEALREADTLRAAWKSGPGHPDAIHLRGLAGYSAMRLGDLDRAGKELKGTSQAIEAVAGIQHPDYGECLLLEAELARASGDETAAAAAFDHVSKYLGIASGNPLRRSRLLVGLALYQLVKGDTANAQKQLMEAVKTRTTLFGEDSIQTGESNVALGLAELQAGRFGIAENLVTRASNAFDAKQVAPAQEFRLAADYVFGSVFHQRKDYTAAKARLNRWLENSRLRTDPAGAKVRELLGDISLVEGRPVEAAKFFKEALDLESTVNHSGPGALARLSLQLAKARIATEDYPAAVSALESVLGRNETRNALAPLDQGQAYRQLGEAYTRMRHPAEAATAYQSALKIYEGRIKTDDPVFLATLNSTAGALVDAKKFGEAMPLLSRLLTLRDQAGDRDSPESLSIVARLAEIYYEGGRHAQATPLYERLIDATVRGKTIGDRKLLLDRVGETYTRIGRIDDAARAFDQRARLALDRHAFAEAEEYAGRLQKILPNTPATAVQRANAMNILGDIRTAQGKPEEAEKLYREASGLASGNQLIEASSLNGLGRLALKQKDYPKARTELDRALTLVTSATAGSGKRGLEAMAVANLAALNAVQGDNNAALELYTRFLGLEAQTTVDDPPLIEYLDEVANLYARVPSKSGEVEDIYRRRLTASSRQFGDTSPETAYAHYNLAESYALRKDYPKALEQFRNAQRIFESIKGPDSDEAVTVASGIGSTQAKAGELDEALKTYTRLLTLAEKSTSDSPRKQTGVLNAMGLVYRQAGRHKEARETFQKITTLWATQGAAEPMWVAASKNVGVSYLDEGSLKDATATFTTLRGAVRRAAGNKDSLVEIDILRTMAQALKKNNRIKEGDEANRQAEAAEKRLAGRR